ncbi:MAG: hypothetical protein PVJ64_09860, partial [Gemmatimonadales bacterium]
MKTSDAAPEPRLAEAGPKRDVLRGWSLRAAVLLVLAIIIVAVWRPWRRPDPLAAFANLRFIDSVAVMPIENRTGDAVMEHLCAGITDEIVSRLKQ